MSYALSSPPAHRRATSLAAIAVLHIGAIYLLASGNLREVVRSEPQPVETRIIQELKPPPPPPPPQPVVKQRQVVRQSVVPPPAPPPPMFAPKPEVDVAPGPPVTTPLASAEPAPAFQAVPPAPVAAPVAAPAAPDPPSVLKAGIVCPNSADVRANTPYPPVAQRRNITGEVQLEFVLNAAGGIENIQVLNRANSVLANAAIEATRKFQCESQGRDVRVQVSYSFQMG